MKRHLTREEVISVIDRKGAAPGVPMFLCKWWGNGTKEKYGAELAAMAAEYPEDIFDGWVNMPGSVSSTTSNPHYRWGFKDNYSTALAHSIGKDVELLDDWSDFDTFIADFPDPHEPGIFDEIIAALPNAGNRYKLGCFWRVFHECFWTIRGMENLMLDYYDEMDKLKIIGQKLVDFYKVIIDGFADLGFDGIFTSDDLGHQTGPMMSPAIFSELYFPLYQELIGHIHARGMHCWLHSCGDNSLLMDDLIRAGLDVFHPVQKGCMDAQTIAERFGGKITFLYGIDVQHLLPEASPEEVSAEISAMRDRFGRPDGGLMFAAGNGIMPDTPLLNIRVMLDEVCGDRADA
jgi:uroporphyrinogen decarboxylase